MTTGTAIDDLEDELEELDAHLSNAVSHVENFCRIRSRTWFLDVENDWGGDVVVQQDIKINGSSSTSLSSSSENQNNHVSKDKVSFKNTEPDEEKYVVTWNPPVVYKTPPGSDPGTSD